MPMNKIYITLTHYRLVCRSLFFISIRDTFIHHGHLSSELSKAKPGGSDSKIDSSYNCYLISGPSPVADPGFPVGGMWTHWGGGGVDFRCGCFSAKLYAKTKKFGPIEGGHAPSMPPLHDPPMITIIVCSYFQITSFQTTSGVALLIAVCIDIEWPCFLSQMAQIWYFGSYL